MLNKIHKLMETAKILYPKSDSVLIAGPFTGEFGWELLKWQGYVRKIRKRYKRTIVISYKNREALYEGCDLFTHNFKLENSGYDYGLLDEQENERVINECKKKFGVKTANVFAPYRFKRLAMRLIGQQEFLELYQPPIDHRVFDVVFHVRDFERDDGNEKNYPKEDVDYLCAELSKTGTSFAFIGAPGLSYCSPGSVDRRSEDLKIAISTICSSKIIVGGLSAPMHLAHLSGNFH